jgi:hypothetical protein
MGSWCSSSDIVKFGGTGDGDSLRLAGLQRIPARCSADTYKLGFNQHRAKYFTNVSNVPATELVPGKRGVFT